MRRAGVTLIELVVGLTIASALLAAGYAGLTTALDRRESAAALLEVDLAAAATRAELRAWLEGARMLSESTTPLFSGADGTHEDLQDDQLAFLTSAVTPLGRGPATVRLFIDRNPETAETGLVAELGVWLGTRRLRVELVPDATGLDLQYRSSLLAGRVWHPSWISSSVLPAGVELTIRGNGDLHPMLRSPVRVALAGGR